MDLTQHAHAFGISMAKTLASGCLRRAFHELTQDEDGEGHAAFGTALHAWLAHYHFGVGTPQPLSEEIPPGGYVSEATLAARYAARFSPDSLGRPAALPPGFGPTTVEGRLTMTISHGGPDGVAWEEPFAGTLDAPVLINERTVEIIRQQRGIILPGPGLYLVDHKTKAKRPKYLVAQYLGDPQFTGYHQLWEACGGAPLQGTLVNILFRYKEDRDDGFFTLLVPPPDEEAILQWKSLVHDAQMRLRTYGPAWVDPTRCFEYARQCPLWATCPRHNL